MANIEMANQSLDRVLSITQGDLGGLTMEKRTVLKKGVQTVVFDLESTLTGNEALNFWAEMIGEGKLVKSITKNAMGNTGVKDVREYEYTLRKRLEIDQPTLAKIRDVDEENVKQLTHNAVKTVNALRAAGINVIVVTGGFDKVTESIQGVFKVPFYQNQLFERKKRHKFSEKKENTGTGKFTEIADQDVLVRSGGKNMLVHQLLDEGVIKGPIAVVGDGTYDIGIDADLKVYFGGWSKDRNVMKLSDVSVTSMSALVPLFLGPERRKKMRNSYFGDLLAEGYFSLKTSETIFNDLIFANELMKELNWEYASNTDLDRMFYNINVTGV